jgi:DNA-binding transcriptional LysR family regulator
MNVITTVNLANIDLNLFHVLHTVLEERSATGAARRLNVTQSAVSNALARLRQLVDDPIVVRSARGLVPTPRAEKLAPLVAAALTQLRAAVAPDPGFDPSTSTQCFTLSCSDAEGAALIPRLSEVFAKRMPHASMRVVTLEHMLASGGLARGEIDAAIGLQSVVPPDCRSTPLYVDDIVAIVRKGHPTIRGETLSLEQYFATSHVVIALFGGRESTVKKSIDKVLAKYGQRPKIALSLPQFGMVALATARTDYIGGVPRRFAEALAEHLPIRIFEAPIPMPKIPIALVWHERTDRDPAASFFRRAVVDAVALTRRTHAGAPKLRAPGRRAKRSRADNPDR